MQQTAPVSTTDRSDTCDTTKYTTTALLTRSSSAIDDDDREDSESSTVALVFRHAGRQISRPPPTRPETSVVATGTFPWR
jgi:hypothetical protein